MVTLLANIFIKKDLPGDKVRERYGILCGAIGIFFNILLCGFKLFAGMLSGSISIMADAFNNLSDAGSSIVTMIGFRLAGQKADNKHPYGHGRIEYITGFIVSAAIMAMGFNLIKDSVRKLFNPTDIEFSVVIVVILVVSIIVKCYMAFYNSMVSKKIDSSALKATAKDSLSDCVATAAVLLATLIYHYVGWNLDGICGCIVSLLILYAGFSSIKEALDPLLGAPPEKEFVDRIESIVMNFDEKIVGLHDLMVHDYGPGRRIISLHAEVPANGDILELHDTVDLLEHTLSKELGCVTTIHMDPVVTDDPRVAELKSKVAELVREIHEDITIHDFRVVWGNTHTNVLFDMAVPFACKETDEAVMEKAFLLVQEKIGKEYLSVIEVDRDNYIYK